MYTRSKIILLSLLMLSTSQISLAYEPGDIIVRAGVATVAPNDDSGLITHSALGAVAGTGAGVNSDTQLGITGTYIVTDHIGIELLAATPFKHTISTDGLEAFGVDKAGTTKHLPPTLTLQYYPMANDSKVQPYVGIGVNYTNFFSEDTSGEIETKLGFDDLDLDSSWGLAYQAGVDFALTEKWSLNASLWRIDIDTKARFSGPGGSAEVDVDIDPWVYQVGVAFNF